MRKVPLIREITLAVINYRSVLLQKSDITNMDIIPGNSDFTVLSEFSDLIISRLSSSKLSIEKLPYKTNTATSFHH